MDDNPHNNYLNGEVSYEDIMDSTWSGPGNQYSYPQPQLTQQAYPQYNAHQPTSYGNFDLSQHQQHQQSAYPQLPFNSPYVSQYQQHARPSEVFASTGYSLDPSLPHSASYQNSHNTFQYAPLQESATISPHSLQYITPSGQSVNHNVANNVYQQSSMGSIHQQDRYINNRDAQNVGTAIQYQTVNHATPEYGTPQNIQQYAGASSSTNTHPPQIQETQPVKALVEKNPLRVTHSDLLSSKNSSYQELDSVPFMVWKTDTPTQVAPGLKNTVPKYHPRKSRTGNEPIPGVDPAKSSTPARQSVKKIRLPKELKAAQGKYKGTSQGSKTAASRLANLREGGLSSAKSPTPTETSSSEEESSSEESESEYENEIMPPPVDISTVRQPTRPTNEIAAAGWDAIGIVWKDPNSSPSSDVIKSAIEEYGNFVSAIRVKLKTLSAKIEQAASNPAELVQLKQARSDQLEALYQTINNANTLGYPAIVENLGNHHKLVNGLTTTLIECSKVNDYSGSLPKAIFNMLAKFQTMSDELLKKVKFDAIEKRWTKKNDDRDIKKYIASILANTTDAKVKSSKAQKEAARTVDDKKVKEKIEQAKLRNATSKPGTTSTSTATKRPLEADVSSTKPNKKFAADTAGTSSKPVPPKRPTLTNNLLGIATKPAPKPMPKKREASPPHESKFGALLADIMKDPEPPKAPEAPARAPETPEEKKRRERKESRRHLRVRFKDGPELEEIRLFKHEQAEDEGRQDNMLRDAHDDRSEGMMHKRRVSENMDGINEDDEGISDGLEERSYPAHLVKVDLVNVPKTTIFGPTYITRGGEKTFTTPEQEIQAQREASELMVVYADPKDIPPTPKEPPEIDIPQLDQEHQLRAPTEPWVVQRLQEIQQYGPEYASQIFLSRTLKENVTSRSSSANVNTVLQQLGAPASQNVADPLTRTQTPAQIPVTLTMDPETYQKLLATIRILKDKAFPPTEPPEWMTSDARRAEWWAGYNRDNAIRDKAAAEFQNAQIQTTAYQPAPVVSVQQTPQQAPMQSFAPPVTQAAQPNMHNIVPAVGDDMVQAYLAGLYNGQPLPQANNHTGAASQYDVNGWPSSDGGALDYGNGNQQKGYGGGWDDENPRPRGKQEQNNHKSTFKKNSLWGPNGEYKGPKKPCQFYAQGRCAKGDKCTYLHE
ncbi:hypothetical protein B0O99DRAFT_680384 [Bisporella sp. PMI_857]|nr:hypothetical protein B0O99DRAFT_680384 [Bisporella sp. PMI_857]